MTVAEKHHPDWKPALLEALKGPVILLILVVLFYWKLILTRQYTWLNSPDLAYLVLPWLQFQAAEWHAGRFPLWDPFGWAGQPLFGQAQPGAAYPLNWLLFLAPLKDGWIRQSVLHWYFVGIHYLAMLAMYALCRSLRRSRGPSIVAACIFALGGYVANTDWPQKLNGVVWAPLVLLFLFRAERGVRPVASAILSGLCLGLAWLAGHHQMQIFLSLAVALLWIWLIVRSGRPDWKIARLAALSLIIAIMASAFQTISTAEYGRLSVRWTGTDEPQRFNEVVPYTVHSQYSMKPGSLLAIVIPSLHGGPNPFMGIAAFALALVGVVLAWREREARWLAAIAAGGVIFALGPNGWIHGVLYSIFPLVEKAREPGAAILVFSLGLAPLAAYALDALPRPENRTIAAAAAKIAAAVGAVIVLVTLFLFAARVPIRISDDRLLLTGVFALALAGVIAAIRGSAIAPRAGVVLALGIVLIELSNDTGYWYPHVLDKNAANYIKPLASYADLVEFTRQRGPGRVDYSTDEIPHNIGDWYRFEAFEVYTASVTENLWSHYVFSPRVRDFFGVRYRFAKAPQRPDQVELFTGTSGFKVFENPGAFPPVWAVHEARTVPDRVAAKVALGSSEFDPRRTVVLPGKPAPQLESCTGDDVRIDRKAPNKVVIRASMACRGMVILTDLYFPGWKATVDGRTVPIHEAYGVVRGVVAEKGGHTIEMSYRPMSVLVGGALTLIALAIAGFVCLFPRRRDALPDGPQVVSGPQE